MVLAVQLLLGRNRLSLNSHMAAVERRTMGKVKDWKVDGREVLELCLGLQL